MTALLRRAARTLSLRAERQWLIGRALRRRGALRPVADRTAAIGPGAILAFSVVRDEMGQLPGFLEHHRRIGVDHFLIVDNESRDGSVAWLADQPDVSLWSAAGSYREARFGMDWLHALLWRFGERHWCLTIDPDEALVYPFHDTRPLRALTDWLDDQEAESYPALLLDLYPRGPVGAATRDEAIWFDPCHLALAENPRHGNLWIRGGPRARAFFADAPEAAPALNKIPLVRWSRRYAYASGAHALLPRRLNRVWARDGGERAAGVLLHRKFVPTLAAKAADPGIRAEHYASGREYAAYDGRLADGTLTLWTPQSARYQDWRQLEALGLIAAGGWT